MNRSYKQAAECVTEALRGGIFLPVTEDDVRKKYDIEKPSQLVDLKA